MADNLLDQRRELVHNALLMRREVVGRRLAPAPRGHWLDCGTILVRARVMQIDQSHRRARARHDSPVVIS